MHRHELTDEQWQRVAPLLPQERGRRARPAKLTNRLFINAVLYIAKTGAPWRDLPQRLGPWKTVHNKFSRWNSAKVFDAVLQVFAADADHESSIIDASYVRAHQHSAGGKGGPVRSVLDALVVAAATAKGMKVVIPPKANRKKPRPTDFHLYKERHLVENFFCKLKHFRRVATRYEKTAQNFFGFLLLASIKIWLV
jgi:transposase